MSEHILIVDDDPTVCGFVERYLVKQGYTVSIAGDGIAMRRVMGERPVDLVVLDLSLPGKDGLELARSLREGSDIPIIMLTGRADPIDRIVGLEIGADDYLTKPFEARELLARIRSVLRRAQKSAAPATSDSAEIAQFCGWRLDLGARNLTDPVGRELRLTASEFDLLVIFIKHAGRVLTRESLLDLLHGSADFPFDRSIDVQVLRLRRRIEADPAAPKLIKTMRGVGYVFTPKVEWG